MMKRDLYLIGAPSSAGAYAAGQEKAPAAFRLHGLVAALSKAGLQVQDRGDVDGFRWRPDLANPKAMNVDAVRRVAQSVADQVSEGLAADGTVLVLGGDCTVELGTVAGALRGSESVGLIYIDFDADLNPPEASDGALDWTGVAHMFDSGQRPAACRSRAAPTVIGAAGYFVVRRGECDGRRSGNDPQTRHQEDFPSGGEGGSTTSGSPSTRMGCRL
jgi:arginase family enzyme